MRYSSAARASSPSSRRHFARSSTARQRPCTSAGPSGIGKSALVRSFLGRLSTRDEVVVLSGRCYEHESVPYKALDGVVDSLSRYILSLPESVVESLMPRDIAALPRIFPVMQRVPAIARACLDRELAATEPLVLRRLAFEALRELLARMAARERLGHLHRRPAVERHRRCAPARRARAPARGTSPAHRCVVPKRRSRVTAISPKADRAPPPAVVVGLSRAHAGRGSHQLIRALAGAPLSEEQTAADYF